MATRIRYTKTSQDGILRSVRAFTGQQGARYQVELNTNDLTYKIRNVSRNKPVILRSNELDGVVPGTTLRTLKNQARRALESLGVEFEMDLRGLT